MTADEEPFAAVAARARALVEEGDWDRDEEYLRPTFLIPPTLTSPAVKVERVGPSYRVKVRPLRATFMFRDVRTAGELAADVSVSFRGQQLFRTTSTLSLTGREKIGKVAFEMSGEGTADGWKRAVFAVVEAVLEAEENLGAPIDLRTAAMDLPAGGTHLLRPIWPVGSVVLVSPGDAGKSTIARALAVSIATGQSVIPGIGAVGPPRPVLYVAAEDPVAHWHSRSLEAICRGASIDRARLPHPIELFDSRGRPLHRIARSIAERAADFGAIILDSQQALLAQMDQGGGIRDRDTLFWASIDALTSPVFVIAHPNRSDARGWDKADGRIAGSEVNRDRVRMAWRGTWKDEPAVIGTSHRRYTLENTKNTHGPKEGALSFAAHWTFSMDDEDPGTLTFGRDDYEPATHSDTLSPALQAALDAYSDGFTTPQPMAAKLDIPEQTAKSRIRLLRERGLI